MPHVAMIQTSKFGQNLNGFVCNHVTLFSASQKDVQFTMRFGWFDKVIWRTTKYITNTSLPPFSTNLHQVAMAQAGIPASQRRKRRWWSGSWMTSRFEASRLPDVLCVLKLEYVYIKLWKRWRSLRNLYIIQWPVHLVDVKFRLQ